MQTTYWAVITSAMLFSAGTSLAGAQPAKPAIRGLVSMGAFRFVAGLQGFPLVPNADLKRWAAMIEANETP